jgi:hypothetical protein
MKNKTMWGRRAQITFKNDCQPLISIEANHWLSAKIFVANELLMAEL